MSGRIVRIATCAALSCAGLGLWSVASMANFYTVIGPDGRPIVIQDQAQPKKNLQPKAVTTPESKPSAVVQQPENRVLAPQASAPSSQTQVSSSSASPRAVIAPASQPAVQLLTEPNTPVEVAQPHRPMPPVTANTPVKAAAQAQTPAQVASQVQAASHRQVEQPVQVKAPTQVDMPVQAKAPTQANVPVQVKPATVTAPVQAQSVPKVDAQAQVKAATPIATAAVAGQSQSRVVEIDGVQYIDSEYLEQREFNLQGKKRFYVMPEVSAGAGHNVQTIEREKGVSRSFMERFWNKQPAPKQAVVLAAGYQRLAKAEVEAALEQSCFNAENIKKAKTLGPKNTDLGYWPVAPIKERFVYEVVKLDQSVQHIQLTSYASSQKAPHYYWPFVVFLDEKGCVLEGVSHFNTAQIAQNALQKARLEGVLRKPETAYYLLMTPLATALDVDEALLSNQGQIKLSIIQ